jgi:hypothetical protein
MSVQKPKAGDVKTLSSRIQGHFFLVFITNLVEWVWSPVFFYKLGESLRGSPFFWLKEPCGSKSENYEKHSVYKKFLTQILIMKINMTRKVTINILFLIL